MAARRAKVESTGRSTCPIACTLDLIGDRWTLLVIRDLAFSAKRRFSEFLGSSEGVSTNVLSERLQRLEGAGIVVREPDPEDGRRHLYRLTERGIDLIPVLLELGRWGAVHGVGTQIPPGFAERLAEDREGLIADLAERHRRGD